jgi:nitrogen fixation protein NifZ
MTNINREPDVVEISEPPAFSFGEKVKAKRMIRNDGTYAGKDIGAVLAKKGEIGYITSIGTFLQQYYIYGVEFTESGNRVGMKKKELESCIPKDDVDIPLPPSVFPTPAPAEAAATPQPAAGSTTPAAPTSAPEGGTSA